MPADFTPPSKTQLKKKYGITNNDFRILTTTEEPEDAEAGTFLQKVEVWPKTVATYLSRMGKTARVVSVILLVPIAVAGVVKGAKAYKDFAENARELSGYCTYVVGPFENLPKPSEHPAWPVWPNEVPAVTVAVAANTAVYSTSGSLRTASYSTSTSGIYGG